MIIYTLSTLTQSRTVVISVHALAQIQGQNFFENLLLCQTDANLSKVDFLNDILKENDSTIYYYISHFTTIIVIHMKFIGDKRVKIKYAQFAECCF